MPSPRSRPRSPLAALVPVAALAALVSGCGTSRSTAPRVTSALARHVTVLATDSLGAPLAGLFVRATSLADSAGLARVQLAFADDSGAARFTLVSGPWAVFAYLPGEPARVIGLTMVVPGAERAADDTVLVRAACRSESRLGGRVTLAGAADHTGTLVSLGIAGQFAVTDAAGDWALGGVPPGRWAVTAYHGGYRLGVRWVDVPAPGSTLALPADSLVASGENPDEPPTHSAARPVGTSPPRSGAR